MNDRYLYRAKRLDNEEWVEGYLISSFTGIYYIVKEFDHILSILEKYEVDEYTICQCTGLKDKNSKLIWENDILVGHLDDEYPDDETYEKVIWHKSGFYTVEQGRDDVSELDDFTEQNFEVVGNIFDNLELLEVEE